MTAGLVCMGPIRPAHAAEEVSPMSVSATDSGVDARQRHKMRAGAALMSLGLAAGVTAGVLAHVALEPPCADERIAMSCELPSRPELEQRAALVGSGLGVSVLGAILGGVGARVLMKNSDFASRIGDRRRRIATVFGAVHVVAGAGGLIAGSVLAGIGGARAADRDMPVIDSTDIVGTRRDVELDVHGRVRGLQMARVGLTLALASPALLTSGVALLRHRPRKRGRASLRASASVHRTYAGMVLDGRF
jgi:hypothetical protein